MARYTTTGSPSSHPSPSAVSFLDDLLEDYDRRVTPGEFLSHLRELDPDFPFAGGTTHVNVELLIRSFGAVNADTMDYDAELYLRQSWDDFRFHRGQLPHDHNNFHLDLNDADIIKAVWKPDTYFPNAKQGEFHYVAVPNVLLRIGPKGRVLYVLRLKLRFSCMMDLTSYPLDTQECYIELASFARTKNDVLLRWNDTKPLSFNHGIRMANFKLEHAQYLDACVRTTTLLHNAPEHERSCLSVRLSLRRAFGHHLVQSYLPSLLIVVISWVSFWLDVDAIPARVTLGVTTLLTISAESTDKQAALAPVSYVKALDIWMAACTLFVFCALLEFTAVSYLARLRSREERPSPIVPDDVAHFTMEQRIDRSRVRQLASAKEAERFFRRTAKGVDRVSRLGFPLMFGIFNLVYWPYYMH
ncbi:glycine receptor subunit alpha-3-like isoform X3 [Varroa jacobsoni]|uniref:glycine receptor subunit alpha-3-like isoform X3 n=1 Tax=Varroa jacobsoni TaxID=62625 RepID=UPI000BF82F51|nr:glycine receptor subunit alpha-3-like isoform X3 [Varroa jacobsoni]